MVAALKPLGSGYGLPNEPHNASLVNRPLSSFFYSPSKKQYGLIEGGKWAPVTPQLAALLRQEDLIDRRVQGVKNAAALAKPKEAAANKNTPFVGTIAPIAYNNNKWYVLLEYKQNDKYGLIQAENWNHDLTYSIIYKLLNNKTAFTYGTPQEKRGKNHTPQQLQTYKKKGSNYFESQKEGAFHVANQPKVRVFPREIEFITIKHFNNKISNNLLWASLGAIKQLEGNEKTIKIGKRKVTINQNTIGYLQDHNFPKFDRKK